MLADSKALILASGSPRRRDLLAELGVSFEVLVAPRAEPANKPACVAACGWAGALAYWKARAVADLRPESWVLGADTIVVCAGELLGKPLDQPDARRMLELQAGRVSEVITGVALVRRESSDGEARRVIEWEVSRVWMHDDPAEREAWLMGAQWAGKAGAYGLQDVGDRLVARVEGSASNVVGLPVERVSRLFARLGILPAGEVDRPR